MTETKISGKELEENTTSLDEQVVGTELKRSERRTSFLSNLPFRDGIKPLSLSSLDELMKIKNRQRAIKPQDYMDENGKVIGKTFKTENIEVIIKDEKNPNDSKLRDEQLEKVEGPALVNLALSSEEGKVTGHLFSLEFDEDGNPIDSIPDLRLVKYEGNDDLVPYVIINGKKFILPMNGNKVKNILESILKQQGNKSHDKEFDSKSTKLIIDEFFSLAENLAKKEEGLEEEFNEFAEGLYKNRNRSHVKRALKIIQLEAEVMFLQAINKDITTRNLSEMRLEAIYRLEVKSELIGDKDVSKDSENQKKDDQQLITEKVSKKIKEFTTQKSLNDKKMIVYQIVQLEKAIRGEFEGEVDNDLVKAERALRGLGLSKSHILKLENKATLNILNDALREEMAEKLRGGDGAHAILIENAARKKLGIPYDDHLELINARTGSVQTSESLPVQIINLVKSASKTAANNHTLSAQSSPSTKSAGANKQEKSANL